MRATIRRVFFLAFLLLFVSALVPSVGSAASTQTFEVSGWMPYWRSATSTADVLPHFDLVTEVNPFVYTLKNDGTLVDNGKLTEEPWASFIAAAKAKKVRVIPTIMSGSGDTLHALLSNSKSRIALEDAIAKEVKDKGYDGIDIDFEGKKAETRDYFSTFLKGLYERMGDKWVMCTIEARTPIADRYYGSEIPEGTGLYANDFVAINKYCDRVRIMTYDQQGGDQKLSATAASSSLLYGPVSDPTWVEKVINLTAQTIDRKKIMIGIPTYGYEYSVTAYAGNQYVYDILWTFNPGYATQVAKEYNVSPVRTFWGEMALAHVKDSGATSTRPTSASPFAGLAAAAAASQYANANNSHIDFRFLVWPDAQAIKQKIDLAKRLGVRGVSIFKWDGGQDPAMWQVLAGVKQAAAASAPPTSSGGSGALTRGLGLGSTGADVRTLQKMLNKDPDTQVAANGAGSPGNEGTYFGPATERAVKKFQTKYKIAAEGNPGYGYVGPSTRAKLNAVAL